MSTTLYSDPNDVTTTYTQPTLTPTAKVKAVGYAGVITTVVPLAITLLAAFNVNIDPSSADAVTNQIIALIGAVVTIYNAVAVVIQFVAGYFKKSDTANGAVKKVS